MGIAGAKAAKEVFKLLSEILTGPSVPHAKLQVGSEVKRAASAKAQDGCSLVGNRVSLSVKSLSGREQFPALSNPKSRIEHINGASHRYPMAYTVGLR